MALQLQDGTDLLLQDGTPLESQAGATDPYWADVVTLCPFDADLLDASSLAVPYTANGLAALSATRSKWGTNSLRLNDGSDYLSATVDIRCLSSFTVEGWYWFDDVNILQGLFHQGTLSSDSDRLQLQVEETGGIYSYHRSGATYYAETLGSIITAGSWIHVAFVRDDEVGTLYLDGVEIYTDTYIGTPPSMGLETNIGTARGAATSNPLRGYLSDFRLTHAARYKYTDGNFTPPTEAFPTSGLVRWTPADTDTFVWHDASDATTITDTAGSVTLWADKSGNGHDLTPFSTFDGPTTGTNTQNSQNVLLFDPATTKRAMQWTSQLFSRLYASTVFIVIKGRLDPNPTQDYTGIWRIGADSNEHYPWVDNDLYANYGTTLRKNTGNKTTPLNQWNTYSVRSGSNDWAQSFNGGAEVWSTTSNSVGWYSDPTLGISTPLTNATWLDGEIAEIIIVDGYLTTDDVDRFDGYLAWKWGIEAELPPGHPYEFAAPLYDPPPAPTVAGDPYWDDVVHLNHFDGDATSPSVGTAVQAVPYSTAGIFNGGIEYDSTEGPYYYYDATFDPTQPWTIECAYTPTALSAGGADYQNIFTLGDLTGTAGVKVQLFMFGVNMYLRANTAAEIAPFFNPALAVGRTYWISVCFDGTTTRVHVDGVVRTFGQTSPWPVATTQRWHIGCYNTQYNAVNGVVSEIRITAAARYLTNAPYNPPITFFPEVWGFLEPVAISSVADPHWDNTELLLHGEGADGASVITDSSTNNSTVTITGTAPTTENVVVVSGSSIQQLTTGYYSFPAIDHGITTGDFTFEMTFEITTNPNNYAQVAVFGDTLAAPYHFLRFGNSGLGYRLQLCKDAGSSTTSWSLPITLAQCTGTINTLMIQRINGYATFHWNGVKQLLSDWTSSVYYRSEVPFDFDMSTGPVRIGEAVDMRVDEVRLTKDVNRVTTAAVYEPLYADPFPETGPVLGDPVIDTQPSNATVNEGDPAVFTLAASGGTAPLTYQWYDASDDSTLPEGAPIIGTQTDTLTVTTVLGDNGNTYYCIVTDSA